jgi:hypothetical protein
MSALPPKADIGPAHTSTALLCSPVSTAARNSLLAIYGGTIAAALRVKKNQNFEVSPRGIWAFCDPFLRVCDEGLLTDNRIFKQ